MADEPENTAPNEQAATPGTPGTPTPADVFGAPKTTSDETKNDDPTETVITQAQLDAANTAKAESDAKLNAVLTALGIKSDKTDPQQVAADLTAQRAENAVLRAGAGIADTDALLDSRRFTDTLADVTVTDPAAVKAHIEAFIKANPRYRLTHTSPGGTRDAAASTPQQPAASGDWLRNALNSH